VTTRLSFRRSPTPTNGDRRPARRHIRAKRAVISLTGDLLRECAFSSRTSAFDQERRLARLPCLLAIHLPLAAQLRVPAQSACRRSAAFGSSPQAARQTSGAPDSSGPVLTLPEKAFCRERRGMWPFDSASACACLRAVERQPERSGP